MFEIENVYNFTTISNVILSGLYKNLKVVANLGFKQAVKYSGVYNDVVTIRQQLVLETGINLLPSEQVRYYLFEDEYGKEILLAEDWIVKSSIELVTSVTATFTISNINTSDVTLINNMLSAMGYNQVEVNVN